MVLVVPSVQVHVVGVKQKVGEQEHDHLNGLFPSINKVSIKHIWCLRRGKTILSKREKKLKACSNARGLTESDVEFYLIKYEK